MKQLYDYSGDYDPSFNHVRLSKESLVELLHTYSDYIRRLDGNWYLSVMNRCGNDTAFACDTEVWERLVLHELKIARDLLNIRGEDAVAVAKAFQVSPWFWMYKCDLDLQSRDHLVITYRECPTLVALEREGAGREKQICVDLEMKIFMKMAHFYNPKMKVTALKLPPRKSADDICCRWEFKIEGDK
jgi:hypothetical protein